MASKQIHYVYGIGHSFVVTGEESNKTLGVTSKSQVKLPPGFPGMLCKVLSHPSEETHLGLSHHMIDFFAQVLKCFPILLGSAFLVLFSEVISSSH